MLLSCAHWLQRTPSLASSELEAVLDSVLLLHDCTGAGRTSFH